MKVEVVDTTGAGDVYHDAFLTAYLKGMSIPECMRFATGVSSIKCTKPGRRAGIPDLETPEKFLATGEIGVEKLQKRMA
jgi:sulfofructose kinase